jgi:integrase
VGKFNFAERPESEISAAFSIGCSCFKGGKELFMRTPTEKAKSSKNLKPLITETVKLWRRHHLSYDQVRYVSKEARKALGLERVKIRKRVVQRLSREEEKRLIQAAYRDRSEHGLLIKTLFQTGARVLSL